MIAASLLHAIAPAIAAEITASEPEAKAAFVFSFAKYTEWPAKAFESANSPIKFCIVGDDDIAAELAKIAEAKTIAGRKILVQRNPGNDSRLCHVIFISAAQKSSSAQLLHSVQDAPVLTVGDFESFCDAGGMIALTTKENRIRFRVNLTSAERARLNLNSKLLALAESVKGKK